MHVKMILPAVLLSAIALATEYLRQLPASFDNSTWAWVSYEMPAVAVIPGSFNRTIFDPLAETNVSDASIAKALHHLNETDFVAYDQRFFEILGSDVKIDHIQNLDYQVHEASCYNPATGELFFVEWGPPGGDNGTHNWQYLLNTRNNTLKKIYTDPPTYNVHGCVLYKGSYYVVTDGYAKETGKLVRIDPTTLKAEAILNNNYGQPFMGFNDLDIDSDGNFWLTDSKSGFGRGIVGSFFYPSNPTLYFVNGTTMRPRATYISTGNTNGIAVSRSTSGAGHGVQSRWGEYLQRGPAGHNVYTCDTGVSEAWPVSRRTQFGDRALRAFSTAPKAEGLLTDARHLSEPISYFYDGIRASKNGYIFAGAGEQGVDVIDPNSGLTLGTIRVGGGQNGAVNVAFGDHEMWIVGKGGVWHVSGVKEELARDW